MFYFNLHMSLVNMYMYNRFCHDINMFYSYQIIDLIKIKLVFIES